MRDASKIAIGFHGHDNLGLGVANAVRAAELGADIIDTSLQGMGRSAGNTATELFIAVMERMGAPLGYDLLQVMDIGERYIKPLIRRDGFSSIDIISGYAQFHSSYMGVIREFSSKYGVDPRKLIVTLCEHDRVNAPRDLVESLLRARCNAMAMKRFPAASISIVTMALSSSAIREITIMPKVWSQRLQRIFHDRAECVFMIDTIGARTITYGELLARAASGALALPGRDCKRGIASEYCSQTASNLQLYIFHAWLVVLQQCRSTMPCRQKIVNLCSRARVCRY